MVYVDQDGVPRAVLTGSPNWTASSLCTQNNNAIVVESLDLATRYFNYWKALSADTTAWPIPAKAAAVKQLQALKDFLPWQREIYKAGHAVVHDKIVVIDPFHPGCVVATGSHNLGFKASYNNDENLLLVQGNQLLAQAYAAHVADVFEHYRWRWYNKRSAECAAAQRWVSDGRKPATALDRAYATANFYHAEIPAGTASGDWQARYFDPTRLASLERQFWVGGQAHLPPRQMGVGMTSGLTKDEVAVRAARAALKTKQKAKKTPTH